MLRHPYRFEVAASHDSTAFSYALYLVYESTTKLGSTATILSQLSNSFDRVFVGNVGVPAVWVRISPLSDLSDWD